MGTAATRGETTYEPTSDYTKKTPTGCIGPNVFFSNVRTNILNADPTNAAARTVVYSFCDPTGFKGVARSDYTIAQNINLYNQADGALNAAGVGLTPTRCSGMQTIPLQISQQTRLRSSGTYGTLSWLLS